MKHFLLTVAFLTGISVFAQPGKTLDDQVNYKKYDVSIIDPDDGITLYEPLNVSLGGDSVRYGLDNYACEGWVIDKYKDGAKLHKGFYIEGQLKVYKNFYPNGQVERDFKGIDLARSSIKMYYEDGSLRAEGKYFRGDISYWVDYYKDGKISYKEEYHKSMLYHLEISSYHENGKLKTQMLQTHKKKLTYTKDEYHSNGQISIDGQVIFNKSNHDYTPTGTWKYYDENGKLTKEEKYSEGRVIDTKTY